MRIIPRLSYSLIAATLFLVSWCRETANAWMGFTAGSSPAVSSIKVGPNIHADTATSSKGSVIRRSPQTVTRPHVIRSLSCSCSCESCASCGCGCGCSSAGPCSSFE